MTKPLILIIGLLCIPVMYKAYSKITITQNHEASPIKHLALIMDGNRRWAKQHKLESIKGHKEGTQTFKRLIQYCLEKKIRMVSVYAFSLENFQRDPEELQNICKIMIKQAEKMLPGLLKNGVSLHFIGERSRFPESVLETINKLETETKNGDQLRLNVLFCYGGRQEILSAVHAIIKDVQTGKLKELPDEETFKKYLWTNDLPDPDLIIRTGGAKRLSNFLTYQTSYSELYFTDRFWPDLTAKDLDAALNEYAARKRNFGK